MNNKVLKIFSILVFSVLTSACTLEPGDVSDKTPPTTPADLNATTSFVHVSLSWQPSSDNVGVAGYAIYRDGSLLNTATTTTFNDYAVVSEGSYTYTVLAADAAGNLSEESTAVDATLPASPLTGAPVILYTDITSGPTSGGEDNNGAYLSIFGFNFGDSANLGGTTKLYINDVEVARYFSIKFARSQTMPNVRPIQQLSVQVGALTGLTPGIDYPVKLVVDGDASNTDMLFMIQPGDIYYVDNIVGNDDTGVAGDISQPFEFVQTSGGGVLDIAGPGDFIVMRDTGKNWTNLIQSRFISLSGIDGSAPDGLAGNGPITIMGYPGEDIIIQCQDDSKCGIHGVSNNAADADWITISNLRIRGGGPKVLDGPINLQHNSDNWRIVNNELYEWDASHKDNNDIGGEIYPEARAGGITGDGSNVKILGNYIHHINGGTKNHGIYVDGGADTWEIAYNHMEVIYGGNIIQTFNSWTGDISDINIHHNRLHNGTRYGVNISSDTVSAKIYNNLIYDIGVAGIKLSTNSGVAINAIHNTLYNTCLGAIADDTSPRGIPNDGSAISNEWSGSGISIKNNILHADAGCSHYIKDTGSDAIDTIDNNLYTGLSISTPTRDLTAVTGNPEFSDISLENFGLDVGSVAKDAVVTTFTDFPIPTDFLIGLRVSNGNADIGAIEKQD